MAVAGYPSSNVGKSSSRSYVSIGAAQKDKGTVAGYPTTAIGKSSTLTEMNIGAIQKTPYTAPAPSTGTTPRRAIYW